MLCLHLALKVVKWYEVFMFPLHVFSLDCGIEYKKGESQTNIEMKKESDFERYLRIEEEAVRQMCDEIIALKPTVVVCEKACSGNFFSFNK